MADTSFATLYELDVKVYLSGVAVPVRSVTVSTAFNTIPRVTLSMPPFHELYGIGRQDRVPIQVFVRDVFSADDSETYGNYILLHEGEISSFGYQRSAIGRELVINGQGLLAFLQDAKITLVNNTEDMASQTLTSEGTKAMAVNGTLNNIVPVRLLMQGVSQGTSPTKIIDYPYQFLENIVAYLSGETEESNITALWKFYHAYASDKINLAGRIAPVPGFDDNSIIGESAGGFPMLKALQSSIVTQTLSHLVRDAASMDSFYGFLDHIVSNLEYELAMHTSPTVTTSESGVAMPSIFLKPMLYDALPPRCNIIYRSQCSSLQSQENVYQVPTRVRSSDDFGVMAALSQGESGFLQKLGRLSSYPRPTADPHAVTDNTDPLQQQLLESELYTGPYLQDTQAPAWLSYITPYKSGTAEEASETDIQELKDTMHKHMLLLQIYNKRSVSVTMPFNPFITAGYPGAVYDDELSNFIFIGHVLSVEHHLGKMMATTTVQLNFTRLLEDELNTTYTSLKEYIETGTALIASGEDTALTNIVPEISDKITKVSGPMDSLYGSLLGCASIGDFKNLAMQKGNEGVINPAVQDDAKAAYEETYRRIITLEEYAEFMGLAYNSSSDTLLGSFTTDRKLTQTGQDLVEVLLSLSDKIKEDPIYASYLTDTLSIGDTFTINSADLYAGDNYNSGYSEFGIA